MQKVKSSISLLICGGFLLLFSLLFNQLNSFSLEGIAEHAGEEISKKLTRERELLVKFSAPDFSDPNDDPIELFTKEKIGLYRFRNDSLVYWNNAQIPIEKVLVGFKAPFDLVKLSQGYYLYTKTSENNLTTIAICLVKPLYDLQNNYLKNNFEEWTGIPKDIGINEKGVENSVSADGKQLFSLRATEDDFVPGWAANTGFIIFFFGLLLILLGLLKYMSNGIIFLHSILILLAVLLFRATMLYFKWPLFFQKSVLYDLSIFGNAQSDINFFLGDIVINAIVFLFFAVSLQMSLSQVQKKSSRIASFLLLSLLALFIVSQVNQTIVSLVSNSTLSFDFLSIFDIKFPAFAGITALAFYGLSLYILANKIISFLDAGARGFLIFTFLLLAISAVLYFLNPSLTLFETSWFLFFSLSLFVLTKFNYSRFSLGLGLQILLMSIITSVMLNHYIGKKQKTDLELLSLELSERRDAILESEFSDIPTKITGDKKLEVLLLFLPAGKKEVEQLLKQKYFSEYFNRYNIELSLFDVNCNPLLSPKEAVLLNEGFFEDRIRNNADSTSVPGLFFVKNYLNNSVYIGKIPIKDKNLYVFLEPKQYEALGSFPDLLLDKSQQKQDIFKNFSYAIYRTGQNTRRYGDFNYPFFILDSTVLAKSNPDFNHYYFQNEEYTQVISQKRKTFTDQFTYNSYIFLFFSVISYCCYFIYTLVFTTQLKTPSLTRRIQTIIIVLLLVVMSAVGITSGNLVSGQFESDNKQQLQEKTEIIINELVSQFEPEEFFDERQKEIVNIKLNEYAHLFNTVISVFDKNGYLFNTSQPRLYELGLAAPLANPKAFRDLTQNQSSAESVIETAGTLNYSSLYTPLYNSKQQLVGFINLPYFARQSDLVNELSGIISALINVYVILFVVSILAGLILSGYITKPLRLIKQQIANISLGTNNEKIMWESNDEIGRLVSEYNQMLVKLESSATLLAQSEREGAWREMAKQVAHEIKNPLTPMKLNLQYLQHLMKNNPDDFKEKFGKASAGIIEQIDSLANIANEFSSFAKLPETSLQTINLSEIIESSVLIFENEKSSIVANEIAEREILVKGDKDQCLRVFNNILKNAMQALDEIVDPKIVIKADQKNNVITVSVQDNGCGIADELKSRIFNPNFTTKSTGSGLGLAMVKNIMQGFGGKVWFETEKDLGTTFYLEFLAA